MSLLLRAQVGVHVSQHTAALLASLFMDTCTGSRIGVNCMNLQLH
jgi:hypothetical protein